MNKLTIEHVQTVKVNRRIYLWVNLSTETETRQCCFTRRSGVWCHEDGDCEPQMSDFLQQLFHGKAGDNALKKCYKTRETVELCEPQKDGTPQFDRELVRLWLIEKGHTQAWLGSQVGAHTGSVNRWLAGTLMPRSSHVEKINRLMRGEDIKSNKPLFRLSPALWEGLRVAAKAQGLSIDTFLKRLATEIAEAIASANMNEDDN